MTDMLSAGSDAGCSHRGRARSGACTVFAFTSVHRVPETPLLSPFKATRESIVRRFGGVVLEGTAQSVDLTELDEQGRYMRRPTGWGDLT